MQYNKMDLEQAVPLERLEAVIEFPAAPLAPAASALTGVGVFETLQSIISLV